MAFNDSKEWHPDYGLNCELLNLYKGQLYKERDRNIESRMKKVHYGKEANSFLISFCVQRFIQF